jgi:hypothetical protein
MKRFAGSAVPTHAAANRRAPIAEVVQFRRARADVIARLRA